ncbi:hypothetical protein LK540_17265 [Massilia sp. IC2-278]|uniref:hypothetical protein n=1 Tax=Massilia sp. IC2-278 TaxID=2887200 RepID=UPI001E3FEDC2|nr:hypothetical protein [Massilia sp. IC2-278]MCC2962179.1 hypothetical protein [Massilia sp. IC2-278]
MSESRVVITAELAQALTAFRQFRQQATGALEAVSAVGGKLNAVLGVVGLALSAGAIIGWIKGAIDATDAASDLSQKTGIAIKDLAGLELAYQMGGMEADALAGSQAKLSKAIVDGNEGLERLRISSKNLDGSFKSNKQMMYEIADRMAGMEDGAEKTALAMSIFGKSGADMIPMLNGGSEGMRELDEMAGKLGLTLSEEAVENAGQFNDTLDLLMLGGQGVARGIAAELLPTLSSLAGSFLTAMTEGDRLKTTGQLIAGVFKTIYTLGVPVVEMFLTIGKVIAGFAAMATTNLTGTIEVLKKVAGGDFTGAWDTIKRTSASTSAMVIDVGTDIGKGWSSAWDGVVNVWTDGGNKIVDTMVGIKREATVVGQSAAEVAKQAAAAKKEQDAQAKILAELSGVTATYMDDLSRLDSMRQKGLITEERYIAAVTELISKQPGVKAAVEAEAKARKEAAEFEERYLVAKSKVADLLAGSVKAAEEEAKQQEEVARTFGMSRTQIEKLELARLEEQLAQRSSLGLTLDEIETLEKLIGAKQRTIAAMRNTEELQGQREMWESIERTAHDTFVSIQDGGKDTAKRLKESLKNTFFDWLYQQTVKKWIINISGQVSGQGGLEQVVGALGGSGSGNGWLGNISSLMSMGKTIFSGFSTGLATSMGGYITQFGNLIGSQGVSAFGTGMGLTSSQAGTAAAAYNAAGNTTVAGGLSAGSTAASVVSVAGWIAAGMAAADMLYSKGFDPNNGSTNTALTNPLIPGAMHNNKIFQALGMDKRWANMFSGASVVTALFGRKNPEVREQGLEGTINASGFSGQQYAYVVEKGGVFRSDKWYTKNAALDAEQDSGLDATVQGMIQAVKGFGAVMGLETSTINGYSKAIKVQLTSDEAKNQEAIATMFGEVGDELSLRLVPSIMSLSKSGETAAATLQRVATNYAGVDAALATIEKKFGQEGLASIGARERLVGLFGGVEALVQATDSYAQNFLTEAERLKPVANALAAEMAALGLSSITTRDQFKDAVNRADLTTAAGAEQYAALMRLSGAFAAVHPQVEATNTALRSQADILSERTDLQKELDQLTMTAAEQRAQERAAIDESNRALYDQVVLQRDLKASTQAASEALQDTVERLTATRDSTTAYRDSLMLGSLSGLSPLQKYMEAQRQYTTQVQKALANPADSAAVSGAQAAATAWLTASQVVNASSAAFLGDKSKVLGDMEQLAAIAGVQMTDAQRQLSALDKQVLGISQLNETAAAIEQAIASQGTASPVALPAFDMQRYVASSSAASDVLAAEVKALRADNAAIREVNAAVLAELRLLRTDAARHNDNLVGATEELGESITEGVGNAFDRTAYRVSNPNKVAPR